MVAALTAENFTELDEILSHVLDNKKREKLIKEVRRMSKNEFNLCNWEAEKMAELSKLESRRVDYEEGIEHGINSNSIQMIKGMLKENIDISTIAKVSGKSIDEIERIKNTN